MNVRTILTKTATATAFAASLVFASACAHHDTATADNDFGHVGQNGTPTAEGTTSANPLPGPAKVDSTGRVYTSSAAPGSGNMDVVGTNTNVNVIPKTAKGTTDVTYTQQQNLNTTPAVTEPVVTTPTVSSTTTTTTETTTTTVPMTSSSTVETPAPTTQETTTTETTTTKHRRMRKD